MYKTIRHGENSLQYTILPQNDDFRTNPIDAEQMNAYRRNGTNGTSRTGNNSNRTCIKRKNKSSLLAYIGLFFVCSVVTGAILVPLLVTTDLMPSPASWFFKAQKARELRNPANVKMSTIDNKDSNSINNNNLNSNNINNSNSIFLTTTSTIKNIISDINKTATTNDLNVNSTSININSNSNNNNNNSTIGTQTPLSSSLLLIPINGSSESTSFNNASLDIYIIGNNSKNNMTSDILQMTTPSSLTSTTTQKITTPAIPSTILTPSREITVTLLNVLKSNAIDSPVTVTTTTTTTTTTVKSIGPEIIINPNKPRILYQEITSRKNSSANQTTDYVAKIHLTPSETNKNADTKNWIRTHWPFIDPSTYFQWAGYDSEDSIILPAILCAALVIIFLLITLCVLARNRKLFFNSIWVRKRSRNDPFGRGVANDVQGADDNTTLLVNENASEEE